VLELARTEASVVLCAAAPDAVDAVAGLGDVLRVAPDEAVLVWPPGTAPELVEAATDLVVGLDGDGVVLEATDGWTIWTLRGAEAREAFTYLSALELPEDGFVQGDVAGVPVKVRTSGEGLRLLVPSMWGDHLRARILSDCAHLGVMRRPGSVPWIVEPPAGRQGA
jgi:hypothetical protein